MSSSRFRSATRDELWIGGRLVEQRLSHGSAIYEDGVITATDERDDQLVDLCDLAPLREAMPRDAHRVRLVADARDENDMLTTSSTLTISSMYGFSVVTTPEHAAKDYALLTNVILSREVGEGPSAAHGGRSLAALGMTTRGTQIVWRNGSASVLLHEAVGHAVEHQAGPPPVWRSWLKIDIAFGLRRATFRDVPLLRMKNLVVSQQDAPFALDARRIEVLLVSGGGYDPLTDVVTVRVAAANLIDGETTQPLAPFDVVETRHAVMHAIVGAEGEAERYPGVVCSREGQELVVGSHAPALVTTFA